MLTDRREVRLNQTVLSIRDLSKSFGTFIAVEHMDLDIKKGEIFGFLGPNGAGKTTTIKLILDILRPTDGIIELFGISNRNVAETHRRIGYLSGDMVIDEDLTGRQYLEFVGNTYRMPYKKRMEKLAEMLHSDLDVRIGAYSRGNKQKIGLVAAMMHRPDLLILDEPSSGFDPLVQEEFIDLIQGYRDAGGTVFISSHTLAEVQRLCDRLAFIREGKLVGVTSMAELNSTAAKQIRISAPPEQLRKILAASKRLPGLRPIDMNENRLVYSYGGKIQPVLRFLASYPVADLTIREPELEEIFMSYYQDDSGHVSL